MPTSERTRSGTALAAFDEELVVVKAVLLIPQAAAADVVHRVHDLDEVLEEFRRDVFVGRIGPRQFERDGKHRAAVKCHPRRAVGLRQRSGPLGSGFERSKSPMLSSPRKPPAKMCLPCTSLRFTHQVKLMQQLLKGALEEQRVALAGLRR